MGVAAWGLAPILARKSYKDENPTSITFTINADALVMIGSFIIGLFYLVEYVPRLLVD